MSDNNQDADSKLVGLLAQFDDAHSLVHACENARNEGYEVMDAYSPFPVHGIDPAIGIRRTWLPFFVLSVALGALFVGLGLQWYTNGGSANLSTDEVPIFPGYKFMISGKPYWSLPANIPVTFEIIVLSSAFATFFGMWFLGWRKPADKISAWTGLPQLANPLHRISRFKRATNDRFFLMIEERDAKFDRAETETHLNGWGATAIEECREDLTDQALPGWITWFVWLLIPALMLPPVLIFRAMGQTSTATRLHFMPDMDWQEKSKTQTMSPDMGTKFNPKYLFEDMRAMRQPIPGTVARDQLQTDSEYFQGIREGSAVTMTTRNKGVRTALGAVQEDQAAEAAAEPSWVTEFPSQVTVNEELLKRGQQRFNIYCTVCHGYAGNGDGQVNQRALSLNATGQAAWTAAKSLHDPEVKDNAVGRIFDTISNGRGTMGPYKDQIPVADRWAIVAYVKALQSMGIEPPVTVPAATEEGVEP